MNIARAKGDRRPRRVLAVLAALVAAVFTVLATPLWNVLYGLYLVSAYPEMTVQDLAHHPACQPGDAVLQTFQPLVSDETMIAHWKKHESELTAAAESFVNASSLGRLGAWVETARDVESKLDVDISAGGDWSVQPYSVDEVRALMNCTAAVAPTASAADRSAAVLECGKQRRPIVLMKPRFGHTHAQFFCTTRRNTFKQYMYLSGGAPRVIEGRLQGPVGPNGVPDWLDKVVPSTDAFDGSQCTVRQLSERWFISLC